MNSAIRFQVLDMTCGHCAKTIAHAVKALDGDARVEVDLERHLVTVEPSSADAGGLADAIVEAGYTPQKVDATPS